MNDDLFTLFLNDLRFLKKDLTKAWEADERVLRSLALQRGLLFGRKGWNQDRPLS
jgi:hypothetical protein